MEISAASMVAEVYRGILRSSGVDASPSEPEGNRVTLTCSVPKGVYGNIGEEAFVDVVFESGNVVFFYSQLTEPVSAASLEEAEKAVNNFNSGSNPFSVIMNDNGIAIVAFSFMSVPLEANSQLPVSEEMRTLSAELDAIFERIVLLSGEASSLFSSIQTDNVPMAEDDPFEVEVMTYDDISSMLDASPEQIEETSGVEGQPDRSDELEETMTRKPRPVKESNSNPPNERTEPRSETTPSPFDEEDDDYDDFDLDDYILDDADDDRRRQILDDLAHVGAVCIAVSKSDRANMPEGKRKDLGLAGNYAVRAIWPLATSYDSEHSKATSWQHNVVISDDFGQWGKESGTVSVISKEAAGIAQMSGADMMREFAQASLKIGEIIEEAPEQFSNAEDIEAALNDMLVIKKVFDSFRKKKGK